MPILRSLHRKYKKLAIGLMSGTSADGIDAALVEITGSGTNTNFRLRAFSTYPYPKGFRDYLLKNSDRASARIDEIARADILIARFFADAARKIARKGGYPLSRIDFIGSHGQTIHHLPEPKSLFGKTVRSTFQIGNPSVIAKLTGTLTVADFRSGDIAAGGSGAPLVPLFDYLTLRSRSLHRGALNIGGIANITVLPRACTPDDVIAFDTGPGNMVIDDLAQRYYRLRYDRGGRIASTGKIEPRLLRWMVTHPYFKLPPPKSTGRETFGEDFVRQIIRRAARFSPADIIATATEFTALSIFQSYFRYIRPRYRLSEIFVSGGGVHNAYLMDALRRYFQGVDLHISDRENISADAKEAICFALLANETLSGHPGNIPRVTGARRKAILGVIALP